MKWNKWPGGTIPEHNARCATQLNDGYWIANDWVFAFGLWDWNYACDKVIAWMKIPEYHDPGGLSIIQNMKWDMKPKKQISIPGRKLRK